MQRILGISFGILAFTATTLAADWPQFRGPHRDGISRETGLYREWPAEGPKVLWTTEVCQGYAAAAIHDGKVYFNTKRSFWILAAGKEKKVLHSDTNAGSEASPVAANGVLYAVLKGWLWALHKQP